MATASHRILQTQVYGCFVLEASLFEDQRGTFVEAWNRDTFKELGLPLEWPQDNISVSYKGVFRGLHIQRKNPQGKLVRCPEGAIIDICLDLRRDSPTFKKWCSYRLDGLEGKALYVPPGCAHGFLALEERNVVLYKCTTLYDRETDGGVNWKTLEMGSWFTNTDLIISEKDKNLPSLEQWLADPRGVYVADKHTV